MNDAQWSFFKKYSFRAFFILFVLYITFNNNGAFPFFNVLAQYPIQWMHQFIPWFSANVVGYEYDYTIFTNGSGDTSYDYVLLLFSTIVSVIAAGLWSAIDYKRKNYNKLYYWLLVLVRCYVAFTLINYGMVKIIKLQFPSPYLSRLTQAYGDSSPMGLAWTFLGYSKGYNIFMGIIEVSSVLLLFRRTMVVGAFLSLAASVHVMSMNYFYDVPVKILSTTLVVMCLFILAPYLKKIIQFFLTGNSVSLQIIEAPVYRKKWMFYALYAFKYLVIIYFTLTLINGSLKASKQYGELAVKPPLYGIYEVEQFTINKVDLPPLTTDYGRWRELIIQTKDWVRIKFMNDSTEYVSVKVDTLTKQIKFNDNPNDETQKSLFKYRFSGGDRIILNGILHRDSTTIILKKVDLKKYKLINRKFNWVNEYPYNR
ncbi:hypothetical protein [Pedobacter insulae]|uniref:DoxX family protein n=1 Tax=Pedobacter insulae TaxID=414048 RepID=A0A1I2XPA0_9SPHI|nr:hypothetical protein [Pedobacter insulae]SFH13911.1 hypothetical protein SAMN04489864_105307 [Pedobacter insulae]